MKKMLIIAALAAGVASMNAQPNAQSTAQPGPASAFQASLTPDIAVHLKTTQINGFAIDIWGENPQHSFNLGFVNGSTGDSKGLSWAFFYNYAESYTGVQWAMVNHTTKSFVGWQDGWVNFDEGYFKGLESGLVNIAQDAHGLQFGFVNYADTLNGVQIGLANIVSGNGWFDDCPDKLAKGFPIVNWSF